MVPTTRSITRSLLAFLVALGLGSPLRAQLDPRLQAGKTDFLDLYQQSSSAKAKPEIITVFDFSASMGSLMSHPLYRNDDVQDADDYRYMKFVLTDQSSTTGAAPNNTYYIDARANVCTSATARYTIVVNADGTATGTPSATNAACPATTGGTVIGNNIPSGYTITATAAGNTSVKASVKFNPASTAATPANVNDHTNYNLGTNTASSTVGGYSISQMSIAPSGGPYAPNSLVTITAYLTYPPDTGNPAITWSGGGGTGGGPVAVTNAKQPDGRWMYQVTWKVNDFVKAADVTTLPSAGNPTQLAPISASGSMTAGSTISLTTYWITKGTNTNITWSSSAGSGNACAATPGITGSPTTAGTTAGTGGAVTWKIPAYCSTSGTGTTTPAFVTVSLNAAAGAKYNSGITYVGSLSGNTKSASVPQVLIKPDGTPVTETDAAATGVLYGSAQGKLDVRNWIRAASHVRFLKSGRTIDIPIPWKVMSRDSTGNPLSSLTLLDKQDKAGYDSNGNPITTTYGSGSQIEVDSNYTIENAVGSIFSTTDPSVSSPVQAPASVPPAAGTKTVYLYTALYRPAYISWLFNGKYQSTTPTGANYTTSSSLVGKYIVFDAASTTNVAGQGNVSWGKAFGPAGLWGNFVIPQYGLDGTYTGTTSVEASNYGIPALTRVQACKKAAIQTWINHQADVYWAFRFLDPTGEANGGVASSISNDSATSYNNVDATTTHVNANDSGWKVLNNTTAEGITSASGNSVKGMKRIASVFANGGTPLTYAMARALAQYGDPNNIFNTVIDPGDVSQCAGQFLILFTDGVDNNGGTINNPNLTTPYLSGSGAAENFDALAGNTAIIANKNAIDCNSTNWNFYTFAGIGAHLADSTLGVLGVGYLDGVDPGTTAQSLAPSAWLPFAIMKRSGVSYSKPHRVTTMTVGVSLGGQYTDPASPKRSLFLAAVLGDPATTSGSLSGFHSFVAPVWGVDSGGKPIVTVQNDWIPDPDDPTSYPTFGKKAPQSVYFFDATDADKLSQSLDYALRLAMSKGGNNTTASPNLPYVGASFGKQVYLGKFLPPKAGGVIWPGDVLMYGTREVAGGFALVDKSGNVTTNLDATTAQWSAADALLNHRLWSARKLFTRLPGSAAVPERGLRADGRYDLKAFTKAGADYSNSDSTSNAAGLKNYVAIPAVTAGGTDQQMLIQNAAGGDTLGANRLNIMGDVINSSPAALEYNFSDGVVQSGISASGFLSVPSANRFRLLLVGTNQGWLHAFAEVTATTTVTDSAGNNQEIVKGVVDELWSFMPTDFLSNLNYVFGATSGNNTHRFMVDGTPSIYFLDLPTSSGGPGNGVLDQTSDLSKGERAVAIIGLGKGGRSYYALDVRNPFQPYLKWSIIPDEAAFFPASRNLTNLSLGDLQTLIGNMGYSTSTPGTARITFTYGGTTKLRDVVFLGGGLSVPLVDHNFPIYPNPPVGQSTPLGRSVLALDVNTGEVLAAVSMPSGTGPIVSGVIPFEFILNSGMAQRAYFLDMNGGLWAWGSKGTPASSDPSYTIYKDYRVDTSDLARWTVDGQTSSAAGIRKVAQDGTGKNSVYTSLPAPFRVGSFPGHGKGGALPPAAVGIAMVSGNRNNPLDYQYAAGAKPDLHRLTVVFDRQDSRVWSLDSASGPDTGIQDSQLMDFSANVASGTSVPAGITPGQTDYYLAPQSESSTKFGYYINFLPARGTTSFVRKGINPPAVVAGALWYTVFNPLSADPCTGGNGESSTSKIADVLNPIVTDNRSNIAQPSGHQYTWSGVASDFIPLGTRGVLQAGTDAVTNSTSTGVKIAPAIKFMPAGSSQIYPKARVWRTVR